MNSFSWNKRWRRIQQGFSTIELLVVISIFALISTVVLAKQNQFNTGILLTNLAYEVALNIRQAQVYGLSIREFGVGSGNFNAGYGVHFTSATPGAFIFFGDVNNNSRYDGTGELIESVTLHQNNTISDICGVNGSGDSDCASTGALSSIDITFVRPDPDAVIIDPDLGTQYRQAKIVLSSPQGNVKTVITESTGQISVIPPLSSP